MPKAAKVAPKPSLNSHSLLTLLKPGGRVAMSSAEVRDATMADLKRSGIGEKEAKLCGFRPLAAEQVQSAYPDLAARPLAGYVIPYFDLAGKPIKDFFRYRFLEQLPSLSHKALRYLQPKDAPPRLYVPKNFDWKEWVNAKERRLYITEGEKKAVAGCKHGFPTMALGGVWNFRSSAQGWSLLPDIEALPLDTTFVYIVFDSDAATNRDVLKAENRLAKELSDRKAVVSILRLPASVEKVGLDDYLSDEGKEAFATLTQEADEWEPSRAIREMNEEAVFVRKNSEVLLYGPGDLYPPYKFFDLMANRTYLETNTIKVRGQDTDRTVVKVIAKEWFRSPLRNDVHRIVYEPGQPEIIPGSEYPDYNLWAGWGVEPEEGDISLFTQLIEHLTHECSEEERTWLWQWLAYPIQHPGAKLMSCLLFHGGQGTGKTLVGEVMGKIYGENYKLVDDSQLLGPFNAWARNRQFILGDEIGTQYRKASDIMKGIISRPTINVNTKNAAEYEIRDCINYLFTSNSPNAAYLEEDDRRHFVVNVQRPPLPDAFYKALSKFKEGEGPSALMYHLLHNVDTKKFNPSARPPLTSAKERMIDTSRSAADQWAENLRANGHGMLKRLATPKQLEPLFIDVRNHSLGDSKQMKIALHHAGFRQALGGKQIKVNNQMQRFWIIDQTLNDLWGHAAADVGAIRRAAIDDSGEIRRKPAKERT